MTRSPALIPPEVAEQIGCYVYLLRDPRDGQVFYVGKGKGSRVLSHVREAGADPASERAKLAKINAIQADGREVEHLFVRTHLATEAEAFIVEQAVIDAYKAAGLALTNLVGGHWSSTRGLSSVQAVVAELTAEPAPGSSGPTVVFMINRVWRPDMNDEEIYEHTRGHWKVGADVRANARYAFGVARGLVRGVYRISSWFPSPIEGDVGRWGFVGEPAPEMAHYLGTSVRRFNLDGAQNPYRKFMSGIPAPNADD
ncbi:hypothetical protein E1262_28330 [Jiangella aurantiaca]|uniref:GIY-YIG domain-containing protein n=1 Tax=Jiangella aurantiaca TaxID=2530373 RepID=A0A4R4ZZA8_9ACTN|nr:hypothetical protein [Jiangella aurantiaca]TDD64405.1 hypothetical protein E1262_28330 [Jiangella aurantiaca]